MPTGGSVPLWVPLVVGLIGLFGVLYTQWGADRREAKIRTEARKREQEQWSRQHEQQREQWAREDAARTYEQRRESYLRFFIVWDRTFADVTVQARPDAGWPLIVRQRARCNRMYEALGRRSALIAYSCGLSSSQRM